MGRGITRRGFAGIGSHVTQHSKFQRTVVIAKVHTGDVKIEHGRVIKDGPGPGGGVHVVGTVSIGTDDGTQERHLGPHPGEIGADRRLLGIAGGADAALVEHGRRHLRGLLEIIERLGLLVKLLLLRGGGGFTGVGGDGGGGFSS